MLGSHDKDELHLPGGHVGAVVSRKASQRLWPTLSGFWRAREVDPPGRPPRAGPPGSSSAAGSRAHSSEESAAGPAGGTASGRAAGSAGGTASRSAPG